MDRHTERNGSASEDNSGPSTRERQNGRVSEETCMADGWGWFHSPSRSQAGGRQWEKEYETAPISRVDFPGERSWPQDVC